MQICIKQILAFHSGQVVTNVMLLFRTMNPAQHTSVLEEIREYSIPELKAFSHALVYLNGSNANYRLISWEEFQQMFHKLEKDEAEKVAQNNLLTIWLKKGTRFDTEMWAPEVFASTENFQCKVAQLSAEGFHRFHEKLRAVIRRQAKTAILETVPFASEETINEQVRLLITVLLEDGSADRLNGLYCRPAVLSKMRVVIWEFTAENMLRWIPVDTFFALTWDKVFDLMVGHSPWGAFISQVSFEMN